MPSMDEGFVAHMRGIEGLSGQASNPIMQLVVTSSEKSAFLTVQGMGNLYSIPVPVADV